MRAEYRWQASGQWAQDYPHEHNDKDYCPECKKAIIDALAPISKKSIVKWIKTDEVDLETLKRWEKEMLEERKLYVGDTGKFPFIERAFPALYDTETNEYSKSIHLQGREGHKDKFFHCVYWQKSNKIVSLKVKVRVDMEDNLIRYERD